MELSGGLFRCIPIDANEFIKDLDEGNLEFSLCP